jgi:hypothetical protein
MPLVFVHGVANRPSAEQAAEIAQRDALFRALTFGNEAVQIFNPDWGKNAVTFAAGTPWIPNPDKVQPFAAGDAGLSQGAREVGLGRIAKVDGAQAIDLTVLAALEEAVIAAGKSGQPALAADKELVGLAKNAAEYLTPRLPDATANSQGIAELAVDKDHDFADALESELQLLAKGDVQALGIGTKIRDAVNALGGWIANGLSDAALRAKRRSLSQGVALFLGDIFIYLRQRKVEGPTGAAARLFEPILVDLIKATEADRVEREPLVVVGHSLGGVLLYDILTDETCLKHLKDEAPDFKIDAWLTVGSQPGFFTDLGLYPDRPKNANGRYDKPVSVTNWLNVYDFTDVFSFLCKPFFDGVDDFGYDTAVDLIHAHSAYFKRPSFYKRLALRLNTLGHL